MSVEEAVKNGHEREYEVKIKKKERSNPQLVSFFYWDFTPLIPSTIWDSERNPIYAYDHYYKLLCIKSPDSVSLKFVDDKLFEICRYLRVVEGYNPEKEILEKLISKYGKPKDYKFTENIGAAFRAGKKRYLWRDEKVAMELIILIKDVLGNGKWEYGDSVVLNYMDIEIASDISKKILDLKKKIIEEELKKLGKPEL